MKRGVLLLVMGQPHYGELAYNMALSIKLDDSEIPICLLIDEEKALDSLSPKQHKVFDQVLKLEASDYLLNGDFNPYYAKTTIYHYSPFEETLFLDVDGIFFNEFKEFQEVFDELLPLDLGITVIDRYSSTPQMDAVLLEEAKGYFWCSDLRLLWKAYGLEADSIYPAYNTSMIWFRKKASIQAYFDQVRELYLEPKIHFVKIGDKQLSDEVAFGLASALSGIQSGLSHPLIFLLQPGEANPSTDPTALLDRIKGTDEEYLEIIRQHSFLMLPGVQTKAITQFYNYLVSRNAKEAGDEQPFFIKMEEKFFLKENRLLDLVRHLWE